MDGDVVKWIWGFWGRGALLGDIRIGEDRSGEGRRGDGDENGGMYI